MRRDLGRFRAYVSSFRNCLQDADEALCADITKPLVIQTYLRLSEEGSDKLLADRCQNASPGYCLNIAIGLRLHGTPMPSEQEIEVVTGLAGETRGWVRSRGRVSDLWHQFSSEQQARPRVKLKPAKFLDVHWEREWTLARTDPPETAD